MQRRQDLLRRGQTNCLTSDRHEIHQPSGSEHVYTIIVNKRHVSPETLAVFDQEAKVLPSWYPGAQGIEGGVTGYRPAATMRSQQARGGVE